jgi:acetamidase/formamidase
VFVPGALFSVGDGHAAQGDGEVCGSAIECHMWVKARLTVVKPDKAGRGVVSMMQYYSPAPVGLEGPHYATTGVGPDLYQACQTAIREMILWLMDDKGLDAYQAYMLCSCAADLKTTTIVARPNWIAACHIPLSIFPTTQD